MTWTIVNVRLKTESAISGRDRGAQETMREILRAGFEPYSTAGMPDGTLVMSFRRPAEQEGQATLLDEDELPGYL